jgi:hypothetical protein
MRWDVVMSIEKGIYRKRDSDKDETRLVKIHTPTILITQPSPSASQRHLNGREVSVVKTLFPLKR